VEAFGAPPLSYKWFYFGNEVPGQTGACFVVQQATPSESGVYQMEVRNPYGAVMSQEATVEVMPAQPPIITQDPQSATRYAGASISFTAAASGSAPLTFQWQHDGAVVPGATSTTLTLNNLQASDAGDYRLIAANILGRATSAVATLTILTPPAGYASAVVGEAPIAYWRLGETSGPTAFDYVGGNHGTYNNVIQGVPGALANDPDRAAGFDGTSSYVNTPVSLNNLSNVTMVGWMRRGGPQAGRTGLWGQNDLIEFGYIDNDTIQAWIDNFTPHVDVTPNPIPDLEWGFLAVVLNSGALSVYTNGQVAGTATLPTSNYGANNFTFNIGGGGIFDTTGNFFNGSIDEVALFNRALSADRINALYAAALGINRCPTANPVSVTVNEGSSVTFQLVASDPDGDPLQYITTQAPAHGTVVVAPTGQATYTPSAGYCGPDSFRYKVSDGECESAEATVSITVNCANLPPVCVARVAPEECVLRFGTDPNLYVLSLNDTDACVVLDGSGSSDPDNNPLQYMWVEGTNVLRTSAIITNCFEVGCHTLTLIVSDGRDRCTTPITLCVITSSEAVEQCAVLVDESDVERKNKRPLIATLKAAAASFERGNFEAGMNQLEAFQLKVRAQIAGANPAEAAAFIACAQRILDAIGCAAVVAEQGVGREAP